MYVTVCMIHSHWLLSYSLLNKMMNTERAAVMLLFVRRSSRISAKRKSIQCSLQPVFDVTLGGSLVMTYSHEDTVKFENPKKSPYNLKILKDPLPCIFSALAFSASQWSQQRHSWKKLGKTDMIMLYCGPNKDTEKPLISKVLHMSITVQQLDNWSAMGGMQHWYAEWRDNKKNPPPHPWHGVLKYRKIWQNLNLCLQNINKEKTIWNNFPPNPNMVSVETSML